ncbi:MAG TPA: DNA-3-methyladenine glycosylase 2 family protein [Planctomycetaceae bacterium]|nr:DNA-3-methyladenine glycosylase 2 family protein [Planctomycetaceae bacterium]
MDPSDVALAAKSLAKIDPALAPIYRLHGPPPLWKRPATFQTLVRIVLEQQVSLAAAKSTFVKLGIACGGRVSAKSIDTMMPEAMTAAGVSRQKARYIRELSASIIARRFSVTRLNQLDDDAVRQSITSLVGFGNWSADIYLMMALMRPDVLPTGDLGLIKGIVEADIDAGLAEPLITPADLIERAERWRPYRSVATRMIWQHYLARRGKDINAIANG